MPAAAVALAVATGCQAQGPAPQPVESAGADPAAAANGAPTPAATQVQIQGDPPGDPAARPETPPPLSEEDKALLAADPATLSPEQRRARAYARQRQILQNPDSPAARMIMDLRDAQQAGELDAQPPREGTWLSAPGTKPTHGRPPAGYRPPKGDDAGADPGSEPAPSADAAPPPVSDAKGAP